MTKFRLLGAALAVAVAAFTVSCDKDSLPEVSVPGVNIGDGSTSGIIVDALVNDQLTDLSVILGEEVLASEINYKEVTEALGLETGELLLTVTAFDKEQGKVVEVYSEYVSINDETFYMILLTLDEEGLNLDVQLIDYQTEDFEISDELALELGYTDENTELYSLNVVNYNVAYQEEELTIDLGILSEGFLSHKEIGLLGYGSDSYTLLDKEGVLSTLDLVVYGEEYTELISGDRKGALLLDAVLDNLDLDFNLEDSTGELLSLVVFVNENDFDFLFIELRDLNIDFNTLEIKL